MLTHSLIQLSKHLGRMQKLLVVLQFSNFPISPPHFPPWRKMSTLSFARGNVTEVLQTENFARHTKTYAPKVPLVCDTGISESVTRHDRKVRSGP